MKPESMIEVKMEARPPVLSAIPNTLFRWQIPSDLFVSKVGCLLVLHVQVYKVRMIYMYML